MPFILLRLSSHSWGSTKILIHTEGKATCRLSQKASQMYMIAVQTQPRNLLQMFCFFVIWCLIKWRSIFTKYYHSPKKRRRDIDTAPCKADNTSWRILMTYDKVYKARKAVETVLIIYYIHTAIYTGRQYWKYISSMWRSVQRVCMLILQRLQEGCRQPPQGPPWAPASKETKSEVLSRWWCPLALQLLILWRLRSRCCLEVYKNPPAGWD